MLGPSPDPVQGDGAELGRLADGRPALQAPGDAQEDEPVRAPLGDERRGAGRRGHGAEADELHARRCVALEQVRGHPREDRSLELRGDAEEGPAGA